MEELLREKFASDTQLYKMLLATGNAILIECDHWGDGYGENNLGKLLMKIRDENIV